MGLNRRGCKKLDGSEGVVVAQGLLDGGVEGGSSWCKKGFLTNPGVWQECVEYRAASIAARGS